MRSSLSVFAVSLGLLVGLAACDSDPNGFIPEICEDGELVVETTVEGSGPSTVRSTSSIVVNYDLRLAANPDSVYQTGRGIELSMISVVAGFRQGMTGARIGEQRRLTVPPDLGYGGRPNGAIPACSTLEYEVDVLDIVG